MADERDVKALLQAYRDGVDALRRSLSATLDGCPGTGDKDVFLLRFLLSASGNIGHAEERAAKAIAWRKEKAALLAGAHPGGALHPKFKLFTELSATAVHGKTKDGDMIYIVRAGLAKGPELLAALGAELFVDFMMLNREIIYQRLIEETDRTGRLCKSVHITDVNYAARSQLSWPMIQVWLRTTKLSEAYYPQLLDTGVLINMPAFMFALYRTVRPLLPKKSQQKLRVCPGRTLTQDIAKCPFAASRLMLDSVPTFLGGSCRCPAGCVAGTQNDQAGPSAEVDAETGLSIRSVPYKGRHDVLLDVVAGQYVQYAVQVDKGPIAMEALLRTAGGEVVLLGRQSVHSAQGLVEGNVACPEAGVCVFRWSNSANLFSRSMRCAVSVMAPKATMQDAEDL